MSKGFTLIELLIVILIISIVAGIAVLSFHFSENRKINLFLNDLEQTITYAEEQAILKPAMLGLFFNHDQYQFLMADSEETEKGKVNWVTTDDPLLNPHRIPAGLAMTLTLGNQVISTSINQQDPLIVITQNGDITPFSLSIGKQGEAPEKELVIKSNGEMLEQNTP